MDTENKVLVIGGGPAGMMAAGTAAARGLSVTLVEKNKRPGRKLMITGKGRCNLTNYTDIEGLVNGVIVNGQFLYSTFHQFSSEDLISFLREHGLETKVERGGRVFPTSDKAVDVVDTMQKFLRQNGVKIVQGEVRSIILEYSPNNSRKEHEQSNSEHSTPYVGGATLQDGTKIAADKIILATGGASYPLTGSTGDGYRIARECGHTIIPLQPSLVPVEVHENWVEELEGLSLRNISLIVIKHIKNNTGEVVFNELGELVFTEFGISGPLALSASVFMKDAENNSYSVSIDLKPGLSFEKLDHRVQRDFEKYSRKIFANSLGDMLPKKLIPVIVKLSEIPRDKPVNQISKQERENLVSLLKDFRFKIKKLRTLEEAIVTSGGVSTKEITPSTMESRLVNDLFFAGETIDVDGYTGGFNLQIAFSTGYVAGMHC